MQNKYVYSEIGPCISFLLKWLIIMVAKSFFDYNIFLFYFLISDLIYYCWYYIFLDLLVHLRSH